MLRRIRDHSSLPGPGPGGSPPGAGGDELSWGTLALSPVQSGLNLKLPLKTPAQMRALLVTIAGAKPQIDAALRGLHYVHFARFLPEPDGSALWVITVFDGDPTDAGKEQSAYEDSLRSYLMDFVAGLGGAFNAILAFVQGAPPLPVERYPQEFIEFVVRSNVAMAQPWSAYPDMTVIDVQKARRKHW